MTSSLAIQLNRIAGFERYKSDKFTASFLFDAKQAADYDLLSIYDLGVAGLRELEELNESRFSEFHHTLFSEQMKGFDRTIKTKEENNMLDESIMEFLQCLSQYFLTKSAGKCLEWLIRRFRINEFNVEAVLMCILPFHETPQFAKMASLLKFNQGNIWEFIRHLRRPIRPLLREQLVSQCLREPALLRALSRMLMMAVENGTAHKTLYTFYTATVIRTLQRMPHVNDHMMTILLPMIVDALKQDDHDYRLLAMIVLSQLAERVTFSVDALGELLLAVAVPMPKCEASHVMEIALCLLHLSRQENIEEAFGEALVEVLGSTPNFIQVTLKSCAETYDLSSFIWPWLKQLLNMSSSMHWMMVDELISTLPLSSSMVERIVRLVLEMAAKRQGDVQGLQQCLNRLRLLYADQVSHLVNDTLKSYHANRQLYTALYDFLASSLKGTDIQVIGDTPLFLALNHADVDKRKVALCELSEIMKKKSGELDAAFVEQALLDRLHQEEDEELIRMTLSLELGQWIRQDRLLDALERLMRTEDRLRLNAAQCMLTQLTLDASSVERVLHTILPCLLACGSSETTIAFADMVLASPLGQLPWLASFSQIKCEFEAMLKRDAFVNASIVYHRQLMEMLASVVASSSLVHVLETYLTSGHDRASLMALLILSESVNKRQGEEQVKFAKQCVDMLAGWLRRCVGRTWSASAQALNQRLVERPLDEVQRELYAVLVSSTPVSDMLLATLVYVMRTVVERIPVPTSSDHDWQDTVYASVLRTLFLNIVQEKDTRPFDVVIKIIFSKHLVHKTLAFLSTIWTRQDYPFLVRFKSLGIARVFLESVHQQKKLADFQLLLPHFMIACTDRQQAMRSLAVDCLGVLVHCYDALHHHHVDDQKKQKKLDISAEIYGQTEMYGAGSKHLLYLPTTTASEFTRKLEQAKASIVADPDYLLGWIDQELNRRDNDSRNVVRVKDALVSFFVTSVLATQDIPIRNQLLVILRPVNSPKKLHYLTSLLSALPKQSPFDLTYAQLLIESFNDQSGPLINVKSSSAKQIFFSIIDGTLLRDVVDDKTLSELQKLAVSRISDALFASLADSRKQQLFSALIEVALHGDVNVVSDVRALLRDLKTPAKVIAHELLTSQQRLAQTVDHKGGAGNAKRVKTESHGASAIVEASQHAVTILELLQYRTPTADEDLIVLPLFDLLAVTLSINVNDVGSLVEYMNQLALSAITRTLKAVQENGVTLNTNRVRVDLVVQCIRSTTNPQTHSQALLLLAELAIVHPDLVLQNIMSVFTFMGASVLRQDDSYSFHVIQQTLEKVIPSLVAARQATDSVEGIKSVISVFVNALLHIPSHRRLGLFVSLVSTLGEDKFLHAVLAILLAKHVEYLTKSSEDADVFVEFSLQLTEQFSAHMQLKALYMIASGLLVIPNEKPEEKALDAAVAVCAPYFFDIKLHSNKQIRQYKWAALDLARQVLESRGFLSQLANKGTSDMDTVFENQYLSLSEALLRLIDMLFAHERSLAMRDNVNASVMKQWRGIIRLANDVLGNVNRLLSLPSFMRIVCELLKHENPSIRRKSLLLFNEKVEALEENGDLTEKDLFLGVLPHLTAMIAIKAHPRDREAIEIAINKQTALVSLALLVKHFGKTDASAFMDVLSVITGEWALGHENRQVAASSIICLGVYCRELGPRVVPLLPRFMPVVLGYMEAAAQQQDTSQDSATLMKLSTLGLIDIMARHMPMFLSPYLSTILRHIFYPAFIGTNAEAQGDQVVHRTVAVLSQLASHVAPRLLLAPTFECRTELMKLGANALVQYYSFVGKIMDAMELADVQQYYKTTVKFFLNCFDLRTDLANQMAIEDIRKVEDAMIDAFLRLVMKLNETTFKPVFLKAVEWATSTHNAEAYKLPRHIFFYRYLDQLLERLKSIVVPYYVYVLDDVISQLNLFKSDSATFHDELWQIMISSLKKSLLYDNDDFWTTTLLEKLLPAVVNQFDVQADNEDDTAYLARMTSHLVPCLGQMAVTAGTDVIWKPLNTQVLLKTREDRAATRIAALQTVEEFYQRLGEEFLVLLPETIPFLAELMEDDDPAVERLTQQVIAVIERYLGESLQKYFE